MLIEPNKSLGLYPLGQNMRLLRLIELFFKELHLCYYGTTIALEQKVDGPWSTTTEIFSINNMKNTAHSSYKFSKKIIYLQAHLLSKDYQE